MSKKSHSGSSANRDRPKGNAAERAAARSGSPARRAEGAEEQLEGLPDAAAKLVALVAETFADRTEPLDVEGAASAVMLPITAESGSAETFALGREVCRQLIERGDAPALAALMALHAVAPQGLQGPLADGIERLTKRGVTAPEWAKSVGEGMRPVTAARIQPGWWDDFVVIVTEFTHVGADTTHSLLMVVDNNIGGVPVEMAIGPALSEVVAEMTKPQPESQSAGPYEAIDIGLDEAAVRLLDGLENFPKPEDLTVEDFEAYAPMAEYFRLFHSRAARMEVNPEIKAREELGDLEQSVMVDEFFRSGNALDELRDMPWFEAFIRMTVDFMSTETGGSALRWSPDLVTVYAEDVLAEHLKIDPAQAEMVPTALRQFSRFMIESGGLPQAALDQCIEAIDGLADELVTALQTPDPEPEPGMDPGMDPGPNAAPQPGFESHRQ